MLDFSMWVGGNLSFCWGALSKKGQNSKKFTLKSQLFRLAMGGTGPHTNYICPSLEERSSSSYFGIARVASILCLSKLYVF